MSIGRSVRKYIEPEEGFPDNKIKHISKYKDGGSIVFEYDGILYYQDNSIKARHQTNTAGTIYFAKKGTSNYRKGEKIPNMLAAVIKKLL